MCDMKISNSVNNKVLMMVENVAKVDNENMRTSEKSTAEYSVKLSISNEGREYCRKNIQQNVQESYDDILYRREHLKSEKISTINYGYEISKKATEWNKEAKKTGQNFLSTTDKANGYVAAYAELYDEIVQGYESGIREIYVADENGTRKLTREEELNALDAAYKKTVDDFVTMEKTNQYARGIISGEMEKISKITSGSSLVETYIEEEKTRDVNEIPENLEEKMYNLICSFKEKYAMFNSSEINLSQLLMSVKL